MTEKIILDTDIGSDIDDAVCLAYLLANPQCDLLGITTVTGEPEKRAMLASALCEAADKDIPIFPGAENPLLVEQRQPKCPQAEALDRWQHETRFPQGKALGFLRDTIRQHPGEITLLTIGPLTNIALLFTLDPQLPRLLKRLVMMCGFFNPAQGGGMEWNAMVDPHATAVVYKHGVKVHRSIGLDVTTKVTMPADEVRQRFQQPLLKPVLDFAEVWFREQKLITFHDPLAATTLFDPAICTFERGQVSVELNDSDRLGWTRWDASPTGRHEAALGVDAARFFDHYFAQFPAP